MQLTRPILLSLLGAAFGAVSAQAQLNKEITIEREIVPEVRAVSRPELFPKALTFTPKRVNLTFRDVTEPTSIPGMIGTLDAASTEPAAAPTPYRGYVDGGYFPRSNGSLSAGYAIVADSLTRLNVWTQFTHTGYKATLTPWEGWVGGSIDPDGQPIDMPEMVRNTCISRMSVKGGVDFAHTFSSVGTLSAAVDMGWRRWDNLYALTDSMLRDFAVEATGYPRFDSSLSANASAGWRGNSGGVLDYHVGASFGLFNFIGNMPDILPIVGVRSEEPIKPVGQRDFKLGGGVLHNFSEGQSVGVDFRVNTLYTNRNRSLSALLPGDSRYWPYEHFTSDEMTQFIADKEAFVNAPSITRNLLTLNPYYTFRAGNLFSARLGARMEAATRSGRALRIAPDVQLGFNPSGAFGVMLRLGGGTVTNTLASLSDENWYMSTLLGYGFSHVPLNGRLAMRVGPFSGASLTLFGDYCAAKDWLMPVMMRYHSLGFMPENVYGTKVGARLLWEFRTWLALDATYEQVLGTDEGRMWMEWRDRSRQRVTASLGIKPIDRLSVNLTYRMHLSRSMNQQFSDLYPDFISYDLKDLHRFDLGVSYRLLNCLTIFGRCENMLDNRAMLNTLIPSQGVTGLVGAGFKF